jgi:hypothetical protein
MRYEIIYVELKTGFNDSGPAWIGKGFYNRTRKTVYFDGRVFCRSQGISGNHIDLETRDEYWISGIKKNGSDRHWAGSGIIQIDEESITEYLKVRNLALLPKGKFEVVRLNNIPAKNISTEQENDNKHENFDDSLRFKQLADLTDLELDQLIAYYRELDLPSIHKKARKEFINKLDDLNKLKELRKNKNYAQHGI